MLHFPARGIKRPLRGCDAGDESRHGLDAAGRSSMELPIVVLEGWKTSSLHLEVHPESFSKKPNRFFLGGTRHHAIGTIGAISDPVGGCVLSDHADLHTVASRWIES